MYTPLHVTLKTQVMFPSNINFILHFKSALHCNCFHVQFVLKRRTTVRAAQRSLFRAPALTITADDEDEVPEGPIYHNVSCRW